MKNKEVPSALKLTQKDYSLASKLQVVDKIEKGCLTHKELQKKYGIQDRSTVLVWSKKHGILDYKSKFPMKSKQLSKNSNPSIKSKSKES